MILLRTLFLTVLLSALPGLALQPTQTVRSSAEPDYPPLSVVNQTGEADGFSVQLLQAVLKETGRNVTFETGPWAVIRQQLANGELDVLPLVGRTPEREAIYDFSIPYLTLHGALFVRRDNQQIREIRDLRGKRIAVMQGDNAEEYVRRAALSDQILTTPTFEEAFHMLDRGEADAVIAQKLMGITLLKTMGIETIRVVGKPNDEFRQDFCFAVKKGDAGLLAVLNEGLALVTANGTYRQLKHKWLGVSEYDEARARVLVYGGDYAFPPYEFIDAKGRPDGFNVELAQAIARETGTAISFRLGPWSDIRRRFESGEFDLSSMFYSPGRDRLVDFSTPHSLSEQAVFARHNSPPYPGLQGLKNFRIAVQKGDLVHDYLLEEGFKQNLTAAATPQETLELLYSGKVDFALSSLLQGQYWIREKGWKNIQVVDPTLFSTEYCYAVTEGNAPLLNLVNDGLLRLKASGEYRRIYNKWLGVLEPTYSRRIIWRIALGAIGTVLLLILFAGAIILSLRRQVQRRTNQLETINRTLNESRLAALNMMEDALSAKEQLEQSQERLQMTQFALDHAADPAFRINPDASIAYVNQAACRILGYTEEELVQLSIYDLDPDFPKERWEAHWHELKQNGSLVFQSRHRAKDGRTFPVEVHASFVCFGDREYNCTSVHDITERKRMEEAIQRRILALTRPISETAPIRFEELFDLQEIQRIQDEFAAATGVASIITQPDGTPVTRPSNFTRLCQEVIRTTETGCLNCKKSDAVLGRYHPEGPIVQPCLSGGLWDAGVSISVGGQHIANWLIGQVRNETQTIEQMRAYARTIGADEEELLKAFLEVPSMSRTQFEQVAQALFTLAGQLSTSAYQNIQQARFIAEEKRQREELLRLSTAIEQSPETIVITDPDGTIRYVNPAFEKVSGYRRDEVLGKNPRLLQSGRQDSAFYSSFWKTISSGQIWSGRIVNKRKSGELYTEEATVSPVRDSSGIISGYVAVKRDITEELAREEQFRQSQKMEAVGQLAGGIAHDFNNILQAILGFSEILLMRLDEQSPNHRHATEIQKAAKRAAEMTRQLLAFSRKQPIERNRLNLNQVVRDTEGLLHVLLREKMKCVFELPDNLHEVYADHGQLTQVIMNLAVNARDAMPQGGRLTIATGNVTFEERATLQPGAKPGSFVRLSVTDTGCGMSREIKDHLFEPFFTTKGVGKGTGLGLAGVYGIVKQNKGWINVYSEEGHGTTFHIYLPACEPVEPGVPSEAPHHGHVLVVEDDKETLELMTELLTSAGHTVTAVASAEEALELFDRAEPPFDLLLSDLLLPGRPGIELADVLRTIRPDLPVLLCSGYQDRRTRWENLESKGYAFLQKPFSVAGLLSAVHDVLNELPK
jgi:PAS domain S-box-containing protein